MAPRRVRYRSAIYHEAGVRDIAKLAASYIFPWIYKLGLTKDQVVRWLKGLIPGRKSAALPSYIPDELKLQVAQLLAGTGMILGDVIRELIREMDTPPPGFRWKKDPETGDLRMVKHSYKGEEKGLHRGKKFEGKVFVGCWWATNKPSGKINRKLQATLRKAGGGVFYKIKVVDYTDYYGWAIVPEAEAVALGPILLELCRQVIDEGMGEYRLSAMRLDGMAERRKLTSADVFRLTGIFKSIKYNDETNLDDLQQGRVREFKQQITEILRQYQG